MPDPIIVVPYDPYWPSLFHELGLALRDVLEDVALRIDHIGSTAIPGLAAKPVIDVQISVSSFEPLDVFRKPVESLGFVFRANNPELSKRYFREAPGDRRTHIHVRRTGGWSEQWALLFRDYMRCHPDDCEEYATLKYQLAETYRHDRHGYTEAKSDFFWKVIRKADGWSQEIGWLTGPSDM